MIFPVNCLSLHVLGKVIWIVTLLQGVIRCILLLAGDEWRLLLLREQNVLDRTVYSHRVRFDHLVHLSKLILHLMATHLRRHLLDQGEAGLLPRQHVLMVVGYAYSVAFTLHLADWSQLEVAIVLIYHNVTVLPRLRVESVLHDAHIAHSGLPQRVRHVASHASFTHEF